MDFKLMLQKRGECHVILVLVTHSSQICTKTCNMCRPYCPHQVLVGINTVIFRQGRRQRGAPAPDPTQIYS